MVAVALKCCCRSVYCKTPSQRIQSLPWVEANFPSLILLNSFILLNYFILLNSCIPVNIWDHCAKSVELCLGIAWLFGEHPLFPYNRQADEVARCLKLKCRDYERTQLGFWVDMKSLSIWESRFYQPISRCLLLISPSPHFLVLRNASTSIAADVSCSHQ